MEVITIESEAFKQILSQLDEIKSRLDKTSKQSPLSGPLLDNNEACALLKVSKGTLQSYRDQGDISFIQVGSKIYYRSSDIEEFLKNHLKSAFKNKR
jgi:excisionase family DNA binding protein